MAKCPYHITRTKRQQTNNKRRIVIDAGPPQPTFSNVVYLPDWHTSAGDPTPELSNVGASCTYTGNVGCGEVPGTYPVGMLSADTAVCRWWSTLGSSRVSSPDNAAYTIGSSDFMIETFLRFDDILPSASSEAGMAMLSHYLNTGDQRSWWLGFNTSNQLEFQGSTDGVNGNVAVVASDTPTLALNTTYHVAVSRQSGVIRLFFDGTELTLGTNTNPSGTLHDSTALLWAGALQSATSFRRIFLGFMAHMRFVVGEAVYTTDFTPPTEAHPTS